MLDLVNNDSSEIANSIERSRQELLDLGLRGNSLLHFKTNALSIAIIDEISRELHKILIEDQKPMSFLPLPKGLQSESVVNEDLLPELFEEQLSGNRHTDTKLQTRLTQDQLDKKLLRINTEAQTYFQEQGIDILYLALGFLSWYEDKNSDIERKAPLILLPVALERSIAKERFKLKYTQVDLGTNLTLKAKLRIDFSIDLPDFEEEQLPVDYFKKVKQAIKKEDRWSVLDNEVHLGFFKFGKFQMYQDLDAKNWPEDNQPADHTILKSLFGHGFHSQQEGERKELDAETITESLQNLDAFHFITDADSSQSEAIMKIKSGVNLVIQGPPGTGKSQTITNIISESLADNKRILFVSEKMVALEVVKKRLDNCHLGDAALELHSHKSNKKTVLQELGRTLQLGEPKVGDRSIQRSRYVKLRKRLDTYVEEIKAPIVNSETDFVVAVGNLLRYKKQIDPYSLAPISLENSSNWSQKEFQENTTLLNELVAHISEYGTPNQNPFFETTVTSFSPSEGGEIENLIDTIKNTLLLIQKEIITVLEDLPITKPIDLSGASQLVENMRFIKTMPNLKSVDVLSDFWKFKVIVIEKLLADGAERDMLYDRYHSIVIDQAFDTDLTELLSIFKHEGSKWWKLFSSKFRKAKTLFRGLLKDKIPNNKGCLEIIEAIQKFQYFSKTLKENDSIAVKLFGEKWIGSPKDWQELKKISIWLNGLHNKVADSQMDTTYLSLVAQLELGKDFQIDIEHLYNYIADLNGYYDLLNKILGLSKDSEQIDHYSHIPVNELVHRLEVMKKEGNKVFDMARYNYIIKRMSDRGLASITEIFFNWHHPPEILLSLFNYCWYDSLVNEAYQSRKTIKLFDRVGHEKDIQEFRELDSDLANFSQELLTLKHFRNLPFQAGPGEMGVIRKEINKKRRHIPIRQLLSKAGNAIQQIKPVFMMSPMSVATFIPPGTLTFDLVIFDEASQIKVVDAMIPILRGKQVVVVGDSKQMPPTDFFSRNFEYDEEEEDETVTGDIESILSMFLAQGAKESMLKWHYRSRHDSLINVSNQEFYDGKLMIFPSAGTDDNAQGLRFHHFPESVYERGTSRTNPIEARKVAESVMLHAKKNPELSLGVVAFSTAQRDRILLEMERLRRGDITCEDYFSTNNPEEFFVKNLENVQGDERDIIFISIGYGRTVQGRVSNSFGPVNREGGERRLNVLITRARLAMDVFCNFTADDLETTNTSPFGVRALKSFLRYAQNGHLEDRFETGKDTDSPFEDEVIKEIQKLGYDVEAQVGSAGFFIDIAVKDPTKPGKYVLAVECDGASYHSSASARDRDRLRQNVLEGMGWRFHRIWSTDWFRAPEKEIKLLKYAVEMALETTNIKSQPGISLPTSHSSNSKPIDRKIVEISKVETKKYVLASDKITIGYPYDIKEMSSHKIAQLLQHIVKIEGALYLMEAAKRIAECMHIGRVGNRIYDQIKKAARYGHVEGFYYLENEIIYKDSSKSVEIRDRSDLLPNYKKIELVPKEEIRAALLDTISIGFSVEPDEAISAALTLMGFNRATEKAQKTLKAEINRLLKEHKIVIQEGRLVVA